MELGAFTAGAQVPSLVRALRFYKLQDVAKKKGTEKSHDLGRSKLSYFKPLFTYMTLTIQLFSWISWKMS